MFYILQNGEECSSEEFQHLVHLYGRDVGGLSPSLTSPISSALSSPSTKTVYSDSDTFITARSQCEEDLTTLLQKTPDGQLLLKENQFSPLGEQHRKILVREIAAAILRKKSKEPVTAATYIYWQEDITVTLQRKWKSIRGCFTREIGRQKNVKSGSGGGSRKSEYIFFKQLQFLKNVVAVKEPEHEHVADEEPTENSEPDTQMVQRKKKRTKATTCPEDDKFLETLQRSIETREKFDEKNDDEDRLFMLSLVGTLKKVPPERKMYTKMKIMSILDSATMPVYYPQSSWSQSQHGLLQATILDILLVPEVLKCHTPYMHPCRICQITPTNQPF